MPKVNAQRTKRGEIALQILTAIGAVGLVAVAIAAPNALQIAKLLQKKKPKYSSAALYYSLRKMHRRGLVKFAPGKTGMRVELTDAGRHELSLYEIQRKLLKRPQRWDGHWHMLIFDIAEQRRFVRDALRRTLLTFGFYRLQDSVWVFPYPCEDVLELLRTKYKIRHDAIYLSANYIADDRALREHFSLKRSK